MFLAWRAQRVITYAGYILGFPGDTPERIARDIRTVKQELPVDLLDTANHALQGPPVIQPPASRPDRPAGRS